MGVKSKTQLYDCDRCMFTFPKRELKMQRGMRLCEACFDTVLEIAPVNMKWLSARSNSTTTTAMTNPTVFTITSAGITSISRSQIKTREGVNRSYEMYVVGSPTIITADPQITAMPHGTLLVLIGTSHSNTVTLKAGNGTDLLALS